MGIDDQWDADLMDMSKYSKGNDEYAYVLVVIDIFLKYVWLRSLRTKMGRDVRRPFVEEGKRPNRVPTNKGQEFRSKEFNRLLQEFAGNYNITYHRKMGMAPKTVTKSKETELWWRMHWPKKQELIGKAKVVRKPFRLNVGDQARITYIGHPFTREYHEKWMGEIFKISQRILRGGLPVYRIKDFNDDEIKGTFYHSELQKTDVKDDDL